MKKVLEEKDIKGKKSKGLAIAKILIGVTAIGSTIYLLSKSLEKIEAAAGDFYY